MLGATVVDAHQKGMATSTTSPEVRPFKSSATRLPTFVIVGAMKSGTTSLARWLKPHPQVFLSEIKELHFFDEHYDKGIDWYRRHFASAGSSLAVGEATPAYMYDEQAPARMHALLPEVRIVVILRNPVDRAYSHYWHNRQRGNEPLGFREAVEREPERRQRDDQPYPHAHAYLDRGRYLRQLQRLTTHYPREQLLVETFDDLRADPQSVYRRVCGFIGVDDTVELANIGRTFNPAREYRSMRVRIASRRLPRKLRYAVGRLNSRRVEYPAMDADLRAQLLAATANDTTALSSWLNRDLSSWLQT